MRTIASMTLAACAIVAISSPALARIRQPAGAAFRGRDAGCHALRYSLRSFNRLDRAKQVMAAAEAEGKKRNWN